MPADPIVIHVVMRWIRDEGIVPDRAFFDLAAAERFESEEPGRYIVAVPLSPEGSV